MAKKRGRLAQGVGDLGEVERDPAEVADLGGRLRARARARLLRCLCARRPAGAQVRRRGRRRSPLREEDGPHQRVRQADAAAGVLLKTRNMATY